MNTRNTETVNRKSRQEAAALNLILTVLEDDDITQEQALARIRKVMKGGDINRPTASTKEGA